MQNVIREKRCYMCIPNQHVVLLCAIRPFKKGAFIFAYTHKAPILPWLFLS